MLFCMASGDKRRGGRRGPNKRAKGEGSAFEVVRNGRRYVCAQMPAGRYPNGKRRYNRRFFPLRPAGKTKAVEWLREQQGKSGTETRRFGEYLTWWLAHVKAAEVEQGIITTSTLNRYRTLARQHIVPVVGHVRMDRLTSEHCTLVLTTMAEAGASASSRNLAHTIMKMCFAYAKAKRAIPDNPMDIVRTAPADPPADDGLSEDEAERIRRAAEGDRLEALSELLLTYGPRKSTVGDLEWSRVDFEQRSITQWNQKKKRWYTAPMTDNVEARLRAHKERQDSERQGLPAWLGEDYVFTKPDGQPIRGKDGRSREVNRWWNELLAKANVAHKCVNCGKDEACYNSVRRVHAARHHAGIYLLDQGVPLEVISVVLDHRDVSVTARIYAKVRPKLVKKHLDRIYNGKEAA